MDKKRLSESLKEFQDALQNTASIDNTDQQRLEHLEREISKRLRQEDEDEDETLIEELVDAIQEFEVAHPHITMVLGHLMDILSGSGV